MRTQSPGLAALTAAWMVENWPLTPLKVPTVSTWPELVELEDDDEQADKTDIDSSAAAMATIYRFELVEPSLEEIFIQTVGGKANE